MSDTKSIHAAISAACGQVRIVGKTDENKFDKYNFASIDKFLEMVNPICAKNGLFPMITETGYESFSGKNGSPWVRISYEVTMHHASGETLGPVARAVAVPANGAQAYGSAQSYVLKQFFRSLFMIPTGDKDDADFNATEEVHQNVNQSSGVNQNVQQQAISDTWRDGVLDGLPDNATPRKKAEAFAAAICADFTAVSGMKALDNRWARHKALITRLQSDHKDLWESVIEAFENKKNDLMDGIAAQ